VNVTVNSVSPAMDDAPVPDAPALDPPRYILVSHSSLSGASAIASASAPSVLSHPIIQFVYADDPPTAALPRFPGEQVLLVDYNVPMDAGAQPTSRVRSLSDDLAVLGMKVSAAPGAGTLYDETPVGDSKMYVIDTVHLEGERYAFGRCDATMLRAPCSSVSMSDGGHADAARATLARYKQRSVKLCVWRGAD
jgi:hypothetical protein